MSQCRLRTVTSVFALCGLVALSPAPAFAQSEDEGVANAPIIVTAQRRAEAQVDVPISITTLGSDALETASVNALADIAKMTPSLRFDFAGGFFQPTIRGIGTAVTTSGGGGNVGIYIDGFYSPNPLAADFDLISVDSIQVLKGPQGTLFGRNTTGGAILVQTRKPDSYANSLEAKVSYGRFNEAEAQAFGNYVISDRVAMTVEGQYRRGDGYLTNISNGKRVGDYENWSVRLGMKAELSDNVEVLLRYKHGSVDDPTPLLTASYSGPEFGGRGGQPYAAFTPGVDYTYNRREIASGSAPADQEFFKSNSDVLQGTISADLGFGNLTSYSQYRSENVDSSIELDYSGAPVFQLGLPNFNETYSQELLLTSKPGTALQWTAGLFYFQNRDTYVTYYDYFPFLPPAFGGPLLSRTRLGGSSTTTKSYAAFVDATYEVTPQLFITAGVRYAHDKIDDAYYNTVDGTGTKVYISDVNPGALDRVEDDRVTPRFVIRYKPTDEMSVYASYTKGYKAGILDVGGGAASCATGQTCSVKPETIDAFEGGVKYDSGRLSFEASAFYYDYKDLQVSLFISGTAKIINAATSEIYGLDGQVRYRVNDNFSFNAGGAYVHARYKRFEQAPIYELCTAGLACGINTFQLDSTTTLRNVTMQRTPKFTGNFGARYTTDLADGELALSGNLFYSSSFFFGPSGIQFKEGAYETLSLRAQWTDPSDKYSIAVWGDNVTDSKYRTQVQYNNPGIGANWAKPITFGVELGFKFGG